MYRRSPFNRHYPIFLRKAGLITYTIGNMIPHLPDAGNP